METLAKLFGSETKVKILRLFLFNQDLSFDIEEVSERVKENTSKVRKEINNLEKISFLKKKVLSKSVNGHKKTKNTYHLNKAFSYINSLYNLLINSKPLEQREIVRKISSLGSIKLIIVSGVFIQDSESRVDLLIVGDNLKNSSVENVVKNMEAEIGKELKYTFFSTDDFNYRLRMFDKLIRDILDYPHEKILNRLGNI